MGLSSESDTKGNDRHGVGNVLLMQLELPLPAGKSARYIYALARAFPLYQGRNSHLVLGALELVGQVVVVLGAVAQHGGAARQGALNLVMVYGARDVSGRDDGRARPHGLLFDGQRQAGRAAVVGRGHDEGGILGLEGRGVVRDGAVFFAVGLGHGQRPGDAGGQRLLGCKPLVGRVLGLGRGVVAEAVVVVQLVVLVGAALLVAHLLLRGRLEVVLGSAERVCDLAGGGDGLRPSSRAGPCGQRGT